jgi:hypothetical protein
VVFALEGYAVAVPGVRCVSTPSDISSTVNAFPSKMQDEIRVERTEVLDVPTAAIVRCQKDQAFQRLRTRSEPTQMVEDLLLVEDPRHNLGLELDAAVLAA